MTGAELAYHLKGEGAPLIRLPGGPRTSAYLGDPGGLSAHRQLYEPPATRAAPAGSGWAGAGR